MSTTDDPPPLVIRLPALDGATAAALLDLCGHLSQALWITYGDEIEAHWLATEPDQLIYDRPPTISRRKR